MSDLVATPSGGIGEHSLTEPVTATLPTLPRPRRRTALWVGLGVGIAVLGAAAATSTILIAPGTTIAGVAVGGLTPGAAAEKVAEAVATTEVALTGVGTAATVTAGTLGTSLDALALAEQAHIAYPMWNIGQWNPEPIVAPLLFDDEQAIDELRKAVPRSWVDPVEPVVAFDSEAGAFVTTPGVSGTGVDVDTLKTRLNEAVSAGQSTLEVSAAPVVVMPSISDEDAEQTAERLNAMLATAGFYDGAERVFAVDAATFAEWITVVPVDGALAIEADAAAIAAVLDTVPEQVNRAPVDTKIIVNSQGKVLGAANEGVVGREVADLEDVAEAFAAQLQGGDAEYALEFTETPFETVNVVRKIVVNLSTQRLTMLENDEVVDSWRISSGKNGKETKTGNYAINWKLERQNMGREDITVPPYRYTPNVKWVMYFNGNQAFHGVYWHSSWGTRMSNGCVGMPEWRAHDLYQWAPEGVEVSIHK